MAYILDPPISIGKSLLAQPNFIPEIKLLPDPRAYALSPHWPLLSITKPHSHAPLRYDNSPPQYTYVSHPDWMPQLWCCLPSGVIPFMI